MNLLCPICGLELNKEDKRYLCLNNHSFDVARQGHVNLLVVQQKHSLNPGDTREQVLSRREFLEAGHYAPIAETLIATAKALGISGEILDVGCGEGYYSARLADALGARLTGLDISKEAVREVGKKNPRISLAVAGSYHMPIADGSLDAVVNTFSPLALSETLRVLRRGGIFVMAIPGVEHLFELKAAIYDSPYKNTVESTELDGFRLVFSESLTYAMHLDSAEKIRSLFMMTPYAYRTRTENAERVFSLDKLDCTADFCLFVYEKE